MQLQHIYNELKDKNEIAIIKQYNCIAKRYTTAITTFGICGFFGGIVVQFWMYIYMTDGDSSTNTSRSYHILFTMEYFIDQEKYFYLILLHINIAICFSCAIVIAIGAMIITFFQHICGIFKIACYRIEYAININILQNVSLKNKTWMAKGIIYAVDIHRKAMKLSKHLISTIQKMLAFLIVPGVACCSLNLFQLTSFESNIEKLLLSFVCSSGCIIYMYIMHHMGQNIIDHNNLVLITAYNVKWYKTPLHIQRMILFLLQIGTKEFILTIGGLINGSMEGFVTLMKATISYFTVIQSVR